MPKVELQILLSRRRRKCSTGSSPTARSGNGRSDQPRETRSLLSLIFAEKKQMPKFSAGQSGNPKGRPRGAKNTANGLRQRIAKELPTMIDTLIESARGGDMQSIRILLERALPPLRAEDSKVAFALPEGTLADQGEAIIRAAASGELSPTQANAMTAALGALARIVETTELEARIKALEAANAQSD